MSSLVLGITLTAITLLGLLLNLYIILVVVLSKQVHTANNLLLLHLGVVDVCVGLVLGALLVCGGGAGAGLAGLAGPGAALKALELPRAAACSMPGFLLSVLHPLALWTLCGLHTDRYFAISTPLHYGAKVSTRKVVWGLAASWVGSLLLAVLALLASCGPPLSLLPLGPLAAAEAAGEAEAAAPWTAGRAAVSAWPPWGPVLQAGIYTTATLLLPATIVLVCNLKVLMIARHHRHRIASAIFEVTLSAQVTITHQRNPFAPGYNPERGGPGSPGISPGAAAAVAAAAAAKFRSRSALCPVLQLLGSLVLLYFPYYGLLLWDALAASHAVKAPHPHVATLAIFLITCSPPVNGLLYGVKNKVLRKTIQNYWRKQMSKSEVNQEIQARTPSTCGSRRPSLTPAGASGVAGGLAGLNGGHGHGHGGSTLQRRLSEIVLEPLRSSVSVGSASPRGTKFQRVASDLVWRPRNWLLGRSLNSIEQRGISRSRSLKDGWHHSSNTLQIPSVLSNGDLAAGALAATPAAVHGHNGAHSWSGAAARGGSAASLGTAMAGGSLFVQRVLGHCHAKPHAPAALPATRAPGGNGVRGPRHSPSLLLASVTRRSPRILITRAFSEESDGTPPPAPAAAIQHSTSASALVTDAHPRRWRRRIRYRDRDEDAADPLSGPLSDDSSSPTEHMAFNGPLAELRHSDGEGDADGDADGEYRALLFSPLSTSACSPVSSPEPVEEHEHEVL